MTAHNESLLFSGFEDTVNKLTIPEKKIKFPVMWVKRFNFLNGVGGIAKLCGWLCAQACIEHVEMR